MKSAKKISAFAVFKGRKDKFQVTDEKDLKMSTLLKKSSSEPVVNMAGEQNDKGTSKAFLKRLKGGSMRGIADVRKLRPSFLPDSALSESPLIPEKVKSTAILSPRKRGSPQARNGDFNRAGVAIDTKPKKATNTVGKQTNVKKTRDKLNNSVKGRKRQNCDQAKDEVTQKKKRKVSDKELPPPTEETFQGSLPTMFDSAEDARNLFECIIHPVTTTKFFSELWEQMPLLVRRHIPDYNQGWFSTKELDRILREEPIQFGVNLDITTYENGQRETHNPVGRAYAPVVWDYFQNGCSVRLLNPQTYSDNVWKFLSTLQEYFGCCVGANIYLTPAGTQGFAPHYDDIEAFVLQLEGKKHWKLYQPINDNEKLPRFSSRNFREEEVGKPILDVVLEAGDLLYFPRGIIHQATAMDDTHSLHITVSCYQKNSWGDLLEKLVPRALEIAMEEDVEFRTGLPRDYLHHMGIANSDLNSPVRKAFLKKLETLMSKLLSHAPVDAACDQMGKQYIFDSLPPHLTDDEKSCSIHSAGEKWSPSKMCVIGTAEVEPDTQIKLIRRGAIRLLTEGEDQVHVYHCLENTRLYHGHGEPQYIDISVEAAPAVEFLIHSYPEYVLVDDLPMESVQEKVNLARALYEKGLLRTETPLEPLNDEESCHDEAEL
ncbi:ribosomal oxygenase 1-like [Liolophura sinensis]|uniref:ribosomal oxygenase 1-like n=1 Tax=Liolophura sinensis TaxID=3198878 RepID=UPI003158C65D